MAVPTEAHLSVSIDVSDIRRLNAATQAFIEVWDDYTIEENN